MPGLSGTAKDGWDADRGSSSCTWVRSGGEEVPALDTAGGEGKPVAVIVRSLGIGYLILQLGLFTVTCLHYLGAPDLAVPVTAATALLMVGLPAADTVRTQRLSPYSFGLMVGLAVCGDAGLLTLVRIAPSVLTVFVLLALVLIPVGWTAAVLVFLPSTWRAGRKAVVVLVVLLACILPLLWGVWVCLVVPFGSNMYEIWAGWHIFGVPLVPISAIANFTVARLYHRQAQRSAPDRPEPCPG